MGEYIPKRYPAYTIDPEGRIRAYWCEDAWWILKRPEEKRVFIKDLPKGFEKDLYEEFGYLDV